MLNINNDRCENRMIKACKNEARIILKDKGKLFTHARHMIAVLHVPAVKHAYLVLENGGRIYW